MTDSASAAKQECIAIIRIAEAARVLGVEVDAGAAIMSGATPADVMAVAWSDIVADVFSDDPDPEVSDLLERCRD